MRARGLSLVELLVGLAVGMIVVAAATTLLVAQSREQRAAAAELRLMQELRAVTDLVTRDLRRAGHWGDAAPALWALSASAPMANPYGAFGVASAASYGYSRDTTENHLLDPNEQFGLRLRSGVIELQLGAGNWQAVSDATSMVVTEFVLQPAVQEQSLLAQCALPCPPGAACNPRLQWRSVALRITARAATDAGVQRRLESELRVRNPVVLGSCTA